MVELQSINVASPEILEATTSQGARITFALDQFDLQLRRWRDIYDYGQAAGQGHRQPGHFHLQPPARALGGQHRLPPLLNQFVKPNKLKRKNV